MVPKEAREKAQADKACKDAKKCTDDELKVYAAQNEKLMNGTLRVFVLTIINDRPGGVQDAEAVARALGLDLDDTMKLLNKMALGAKYCNDDPCTEDEINAWTEDKGSSLPTDQRALAEARAAQAAAEAASAASTRRIVLAATVGAAVAVLVVAGVRWRS